MKTILLFLILSFLTPTLCFSQENEKTLLVFSAKLCKFCTKMKNDMNNNPAVAEALKEYSIIELDYDTDKDIANSHQVKILPTIIIFQNGKEISRKTGYNNVRDLSKFLE